MDTPKLNLKAVVGVAVGAIVFLIALSTSPGQGFIATSAAVQIPQALQLAFNGLLFASVTAGFVWILNKIGLNLLGLAEPLAGTVSAFLLGLAQGWINVQPVTSDPYIQMILNILVVVIGGLPLYVFVRNRMK